MKQVFKSIFSTKDNLVKFAAYVLIFLSLVFGFVSRVVAVFRYTTFFYYDQVRDAQVYMDMWKGHWPTLGPSASVGGYSLPPLYYYLVFPFTVLGPDPVFQALPNALFSLFSIPLLIYLVYRLLEDTEGSRRLLLASLAGFWYSLLFVDIFISTFQWNPSPIPFFILCFTLLYNFQLETKLSVVVQVLSWIFYGIILAILVSLHSTTMFVMPIVFIGSSIFFIFKNFKKKYRWLFPALSILTGIVILLPYWKGESSRSWLNTKGILFKLTNASQEANSHTVLQRIGRAFHSYFELGQQAYFIGNAWWLTFVGITFFSAVLILAIAKFRKNSIIFLFLLFTWLIYFYAASNFWGMSVVHNKFLVLFAPIILTILSLASLDVSKKIDKLINVILILGISLSIWMNLTFDYQYFSSKYGTNRLITTADITQIFHKLPANSIICDPRSKEGWLLYNPYKSYKYIDKYITKKELKFIESCQPGHYFLQPRFEMLQSIEIFWPIFRVSAAKLSEENHRLFSGTSVADVYILK